MEKRGSFAAITCASMMALCGVAAAQDSISVNPDGGNGLPGDAFSPWSTDGQCASYVLDLVPVTSSKGTVFGTGPIIKSSKASSAFFGSLTSSHSISNTTIFNATPASASYSLWNGQGFGVNTFGMMPPNLAGMAVEPGAAVTAQFAVAMSEFASADDGTNHNGLNGAIVNFDPSDDQRLYVTRINIATGDEDGMGNDDDAGIGFGSVDANGNVYLRADNFMANGGDQVVGDNIYRVKMPGRDCDLVNALNESGAGDAGATERVINNYMSGGGPEVTVVPAHVPSDLSLGGRPIVATTTFSAEYVYESAAGTITVDPAAYRPGTSDTRGTPSFSKTIVYTGSVGTMGLMTKSNGGGGATDTMSIWGVDGNGAPVAGHPLTLPAAVSDNCENYTAIGYVFDGYRGGIPFNGGNGHVAVGMDRSGKGLAACTAYLAGERDNPFQAIAVARFDKSDPDGTAEWTLAAWNDPTMPPNVGGKAICNANGDQIGRLGALFELTGGTPQGPSMSSPAIDSAGNIWFMGVVGFTLTDPPKGGPTETFDICLLRAIYDETNFCFDLEVVLCAGDRFVGANSNTEYQMQFFNLADSPASNPSGSLSSGAFFSMNLNQCTWNGADVADLAQDDSQTLGGVVVAVDMVYDVDGDGDFDDPTSGSPGADPNSLDESYNVLMFIGGVTPDDPCPWDLNGDGVVGAADLADLIGFWGQCGVPADFFGDCVGADDLAELIGRWGPCP